MTLRRSGSSLTVWQTSNVSQPALIDVFTCLHIIIMCTGDMNNVPCVTDCTRELNEWVYSDVRGRDKLFSTPPRELPELVRRFTQDIYMCVYVQRDAALYGDSDGEEEYHLSPVREPCSIVSEGKCSFHAEYTINTCRCCPNSTQANGEQR